MNQETLRELLAKVHQRLEKGGPIDQDARAMLATLVDSGRATQLRVAQKTRWVAVEDVAKYRDALGAAYRADDTVELAGKFRDEVFGAIAEAKADERGHY